MATPVCHQDQGRLMLSSYCSAYMLKPTTYKLFSRSYGFYLLHCASPVCNYDGFHEDNLFPSITGSIVLISDEAQRSSLCARPLLLTYEMRCIFVLSENQSIDATVNFFSGVNRISNNTQKLASADPARCHPTSLHIRSIIHPNCCVICQEK